MKVFLAGFFLLGCLHISSGKDDTTTGTPETTTTVSTCQGLAAQDCEACTASVGCKFVSTGEGGDNVCLGVDDPLPGEGDWKVFYNTTECGGGGEDPYTTQPTPPDTTTEPGNTTTTTTTTSTTTTTTTTTITTSTTTTLTTSTTTMSTTSTTPASNSTTSTTTTTTTTTTPASTVAPQPSPDAGRGSFDGWSFFGGILLTLGLAAIGLVGYKYYRLRSGTAGNYNRF